MVNNSMRGHACAYATMVIRKVNENQVLYRTNKEFQENESVNENTSDKVSFLTCTAHRKVDHCDDDGDWRAQPVACFVGASMHSSSTWVRSSSMGSQP